MVECNLAKVDVAGSNPVSRSIFFGPLAQLVEQVTLNHKVTGSTPVRPTIDDAHTRKCPYAARRAGERLCLAVPRRRGRVAELADALDLGSSIARCAGSSPASPTNSR